jgi:hypothetical protein
VSSHAPSVFKLGCGSSVVCRLLSLVEVRTHNQIEYGNNKLIHEHNLVSIEFNGANYFLRCITCGTYFCQLCGKVGLHNSHDGIPARRKTKRPINILKSFH